jgi:hypothetical protein
MFQFVANFYLMIQLKVFNNLAKNNIHCIKQININQEQKTKEFLNY